MVLPLRAAAARTTALRLVICRAVLSSSWIARVLGPVHSLHVWARLPYIAVACRSSPVAKPIVASTRAPPCFHAASARALACSHSRMISFLSRLP